MPRNPCAPIAGLLPVPIISAFLLLSGCSDGPTEPPRAASIILTPATITIVAGDSTTFTASAVDASGKPVEGRDFTWSSDDPDVAEVSADGRAVGTGAGTARIRATLDGVSGEATITVERDPFLAAFAPVLADTMRVVPFATNAVLDVAQVRGVTVRLDERRGTISLTFVNASRAAIGAPVELAPDSTGRPGQYRMVARNATLLGATGVTVYAWVLDPPVDESSLAVTIETRPGFGPPSARVAARGPDDRRGFIEKWQELRADESLTDVDRWARLVQHIVDVNLPQHTDESDFIEAVTDDMADVFINDVDYRKWLVDGETVLGGGEFIGDPGGRTGFAPVFRGGEGRFRHFSANAALNEDYWPEPLINLMGRIMGGDFNPEDDPTGDIAADLATNELGRKFPVELARLWDAREENSSGARIDDGDSVRRWIMDGFASRVATVTIGTVADGRIGESGQLVVTQRDAEGGIVTGFGVTFSSSNPDIVTVDGTGKITRTGPGTATVTVTSEHGPAGTVQVSVPDILTVTPLTPIAFTHTVAVTAPCPQAVGTVTVRNTYTEPVQWSAVETNYGGFVRLRGTPGSGTLQPGQSVVVTVEFLCNTDQSFTNTFEINGTTGSPGRQSRQLVGVTGTIDASPGSLTITTSSSGVDIPQSFTVEDVELGTTIGTIGPNEAKTFPNVRPGRYPVRLVPQPADANCTAAGSFVHDVVVPAGGSGTAAWSIQCESAGPSVHIATPEDNAVYDAGTIISFVGSATDPQDGQVPASGLEWSSSIDGVFCTGNGCIRQLSPGTHTITLTATDSDGNRGQSSVTVTVNAATPDLRIGALVPGTQQAPVGALVWANIRAENAGTAATPSSFQARLYLSADPMLDAGDVAVGSGSGAALAAGASRDMQLVGTIPQALPPGSYWWIAVLDPADAIEESNESNNSRVSDSQVTVFVPPLITVSPSELVRQHSVQLSPCPDNVGTVLVSNPGTSTVVVTASWSGGNEIATEPSQVSIPAGQSRSIAVRFTCSTTTSFTGTLTLAAQSSARSATVSVPVSVGILQQGVVLGHAIGGFAAGTFITMSRISGGTIAGPDACPDTHLHGTILIDGQGPYADPDSSACGHGIVAYRDPAAPAAPAPGTPAIPVGAARPQSERRR